MPKGLPALQAASCEPGLSPLKKGKGQIRWPLIRDGHSWSHDLTIAEVYS